MNYLGNLSLLDQPKHGFLCSRCTESRVILPCLDWAVMCSQDTIPVMSTFHSKMEEAILDMLIPGRCPVILILGRSIYKQLPEKLKPLLEANRLLIVSISEQKRISKQSAYECNKYICEQASDLTFGYLSHDSSLLPLYEESTKKKPTHIINKDSLVTHYNSDYSH